LKLKTLKLTTLISPLALALSLAIAHPVLAKAEHGRDHDKNQLRHMMAKLDLSQEQRQDVKHILQQSRADAGLVAEDQKQARTDLMNLIHTSSWNETAVETVLLQNQQTKASLGLEKASAMHQIWLVLSDEQQAKFAQIPDNKADGKRGKKENKAKLKDGADGHERSRGEGKDHFKQLALTDEQKTAIKTIKQQTKAQNEQSKEQQQAYRQAERALIASTTFNDTAYQVLQAEYQDEHLQHALLMAKTRHEIWNVLSAEQQAKALTKMAERKERG
jgi:protein CpxP